MSTDLSELTCPDCGAREQREAFCDSCGAALTRAKPAVVGAGAPAAFQESPSGESAGSTGSTGNTGNTGSAESAAGVAAIPSARSGEAAVSAPTAEHAPGLRLVVEEADTVPLDEVAKAEAERRELADAAAERADQAEEAERAERAERARALLVPVADQTEQPPGIVPVLPGKPDPVAPQRKNAEALEALDAGIECQWCATRNPPERHFCRRCGQRLAYAPVEARRPSWWRRVFFFWRNRPLPFAGQRPRLRRGPGQAIRPVVWAVVVVVVIVVVVQEYSPVSKNVRDHFAKPNEISNWTISASHEDPDHKAKLLHDTYSDTWWGSGFSPQNTNGASVTVTFSQPANLLDLGITPGAGTAADTFGAQGSPETIEAELIPIPGKGAPIKKTFTLDDQPGFQKVQLRGDDIRQVVLTITSSYPPTAADPAKAVETAVTELEFYTRH